MSDRWIRQFHEAPEARTVLLCLPHAGGSAGFYHPVSRALAPAVRVLAVQYPGRQDRIAEPPVGDVAELADRILAELPAAGVDGSDGGRLVLFGHSIGATVGFELARRLERGGGPRPDVLLVSNRRAPSLPTGSAVHTYDDAGLVAELRRADGTEPALLAHEELLRLALPALRADYRAVETYPPTTARLRCPIRALLADRDRMTSKEQALAWRDHTAADFDLTILPGNHFYSGDWTPDLLAAITAHL
jgi:surfactin synthase thioesterase subunit